MACVCRDIAVFDNNIVAANAIAVCAAVVTAPYFRRLFRFKIKRCVLYKESVGVVDVAVRLYYSIKVFDIRVVGGKLVRYGGKAAAVLADYGKAAIAANRGSSSIKFVLALEDNSRAVGNDYRVKIA